MVITTQLDKSTLGKITSCIKDFEIEEANEQSSTKKIKKAYLDAVLYAPDLAEALWRNASSILLFNDFTTLLPDKILLDELENEDAEGYDAVQNIQKLLRNDFKKISKKNTPQKNSTTEVESADLSANFQEDWQQKIYGNNKVNIKFFIENNETGKKEISFYVETKDNEFLAPRRRSKGMIWFLSLWLELKAKENSESLVLLFDEPGLHLHIKANKDMLKVFHKLIEKGHQVIYSTHSPSLIETDKLHNIGLVINNEKGGTFVEGLTTSKINSQNKKDALQPIAEAMGMEPLKDFSILKARNVLLEGLSDFWYFKGMSKLLRPNINHEFIPGIGIKGNKIQHLISFCLGYGLQWLLIMDNGELPIRVRDELKEELFAGSDVETNKKIKLLPVREIENIFSQKDLLLIDSSIKEDNKKTPIEIIGSKRKIVFSKMFYQKVENGEIKKSQLHADTIKGFEEALKWIDTQFAAK
jgi:predicted ATP-dependent endonuclease of OLD family